MQDHDFEKQVHQKMEEMKILPSDAVWKEVERRLHPKRKKRTWIWFLFLFLALGIGGYLMVTNKPAFLQSGQPGTKLSLHNTNAPKDHTAETTYSDQVSKTTKDKKQGTTSIATLSTTNKEKRLSGKGEKPAVPGQSTLPDPAIHTTSQAGKRGKRVISSLSHNNSLKRNMHIGITKEKPIDMPPLHQTGTLSSGLSTLKTGDSSGNTIITKEPVPAHIDSSITPFHPVNTSLALPDFLIAANAPVRKHQKRPGCEWGFSVQAGQSDIRNGKFTSLFSREAVADMNNSFSSGNPSANPAAIYIPPSSLKSGPGYSAGLSVKKQLTKRTSVSAGLQYTRFTTSYRVGKRVTDSTVLLQSNSVADQKAVKNYYRLGNSGNYINRYHFIELPVSFETRLTSDRLMPVYWNLGISYSRLVSSNALHFDGGSKIYYTNNSLFNRNQFHFITGLPVRILQDERYSLKAGPLFQYGLSNMMNKAGGGSRHVLFIGVKANITLFK